MSAGSSPSARVTVWLLLLVMAAAGWAVAFTQARSMSNMSGVDMGLVSGMSMGPAPLLLFLAVWIAMMVAMMFPSVAPMVMLFATVSRNRRLAGERTAPTSVFLVGYLAVWGLFGIGAYLVSLIVPAMGMAGPGLRVYSPLMGGLVLILAGLYQWSPLKRVCLEHCRSPLAFLLHGWSDGYAGAFRMAVTHGAYCVGCCWGLMIVLFAVGFMSLGWMVLLAAVIFVEKIVRHGQLIGKFVGAALVLYGMAGIAISLLHRLAPGST
jgi:predicted metal-binding membrane protein